MRTFTRLLARDLLRLDMELDFRALLLEVASGTWVVGLSVYGYMRLVTRMVGREYSFFEAWT